MSDNQCEFQWCSNSQNEVVHSQILAIVACVSGVTWGISFESRVWYASLILAIFYQMLWCVSIPKKLHWAFIVPTLVISGCNFYSAIDSVIDNIGLLSLVYWIPAFLWLGAAILQLVFVLRKSETYEQNSDNQRHDTETVAVAVAVAVKENV